MEEEGTLDPGTKLLRDDLLSRLDPRGAAGVLRSKGVIRRSSPPLNLGGLAVNAKLAAEGKPALP